jgi:hypothetical protein
MIKILLSATFLLLGLSVRAQVNNPTLIFVTTAPTGSCTVPTPLQSVISTGSLYSCQAGTWTQIGSGGGGGAVASVFGRTGAVVAASGDYTAAQVTNAAATNAANTFTQPQTINTGNSLTGLTLAGASAWTIAANQTDDLIILEDAATSTFSPVFANGPAFNTGAGGMALTGGFCYLWNGSNNAFLDVQAGLCATAFGTPAQAIVQLGNGVANDTSGWLQLSAIGNGASGNTDLRGHLTLALGTATFTFTKTYTVAPTCVATDTTAIATVQTVSTATALTVNGTGSDVVNYVCAD